MGGDYSYSHTQNNHHDGGLSSEKTVDKIKAKGIFIIILLFYYFLLL